VEENAPAQGAPVDARLKLVGIAQGRADELALTMLSHVLPPDTQAAMLPYSWLAAEKVKGADEHRPDAVLISAVGPDAVAHARYLTKRLSQALPDTPIVVCRWAVQGDRGHVAASLKARGATQVVFDLAEAIDCIERLQPTALTAAAV
jgi:hypothetical protein